MKKGSDADSDASSEEDGYLDSKEVDYLSDSSSSSEGEIFRTDYHIHLITIGVCISHQSDCCMRVCISHQSYHSIWISCICCAQRMTLIRNFGIN